MARRTLAISGQPVDKAVVAVDFDAYLAEDDHADEPLVVRVGGEDWELPPSLPAGLAIRVMAMQARGKNAKVKPSEAVGMLRAVFGPQTQEILDLVPGHRLPDLLEQVIDAYAARTAEGKPPAPTTGPPPKARAKAKKHASRG